MCKKLLSTISSNQINTSKLVAFLNEKKYVVAITGAGISTNSGIPDYRGPNGSYSRGHKPMMHKDFVTKDHARRRFVISYYEQCSDINYADLI